MALFAPLTGRRTWLAAAIAGVMLLLLAPSAARAQEAPTALPASLETAVVAAAATEAGVPAAEVSVLRAESVTWADGCLGITSTEVCTQAQVDGYVAWVQAGDTVLRYHTDETTDVRLGQSGLLTSSVASAPLPAGATARVIEELDLIDGEIPTSGFAMFGVNADASTTDVRTALAGEGCDASVLAKTVGGAWVIYGFDAPDFANAASFSADGTAVGQIAANSILLANCGAVVSTNP